MYGHIYLPIINIEDVRKNKTYIFDYGHHSYSETKMGQFTILHRYTCTYSPSNVTYTLHCPMCSKYGEDSVTASYIFTEHKNLRFYLTHSHDKCPVINRKYTKLQANLLCDQCFEPI
jgi:hypothetical protein